MNAESLEGDGYGNDGDVDDGEDWCESEI